MKPVIFRHRSSLVDSAKALMGLLMIAVAIPMLAEAERIRNPAWVCPNGLSWEECGHTECGEKWLCTDDIGPGMDAMATAGDGLTNFPIDELEEAEQATAVEASDDLSFLSETEDQNGASTREAVTNVPTEQRSASNYGTVSTAAEAPAIFPEAGARIQTPYCSASETEAYWASPDLAGSSSLLPQDSEEWAFDHLDQEMELYGSTDDGGLDFSAGEESGVQPGPKADVAQGMSPAPDAKTQQLVEVLKGDWRYKFSSISEEGAGLFRVNYEEFTGAFTEGKTGPYTPERMDVTKEQLCNAMNVSLETARQDLATVRSEAAKTVDIAISAMNEIDGAGISDEQAVWLQNQMRLGMAGETFGSESAKAAATGALPLPPVASVILTLAGTAWNVIGLTGTAAEVMINGHYPDGGQELLQSFGKDTDGQVKHVTDLLMSTSKGREFLQEQGWDTVELGMPRDKYAQWDPERRDYSIYQYKAEHWDQYYSPSDLKSGYAIARSTAARAVSQVLVWDRYNNASRRLQRLERSEQVLQERVRYYFDMLRQWE